MKKIRVFFATLGEGFKSLWKHRGMGFASVISIMLALIILGVILVSSLTLNQYIMDLETKVDEIVIYMKKDSTEEQKNALESTLNQNSYIKSVKFKSKEEALEEYKKTLKDDQAYLFEGMEKALPNSFVITLSDISKADEFVVEAKNYEGVDNINYYKDTVERVLKISKYVQLGGAAAVVALVVISILIISNTIKLTVVARKREIQIKKYIGTTNPVIIGPFIFEGMIFGLIGSGLSFLAIYFGYDFLFKKFAGVFEEIVAGYLIPMELMYVNILIIFLTLGIGIGIIGSLLSIRKYLKV
ncbi:permease-like cell division protein FtsX [Miniphocaeibacter massiliensis]|uniref:permease-like cell division protein FtsX n=1 Tax=Miniphocaeibacter massiliensis TaxID=2041841 RepID=UPI000C1BB7DD|nr:permease-like cell division protein FtsX [Miniphocaeibacter massiliensis]